MGVAATADSAFEWREVGAHVTRSSPTPAATRTPATCGCCGSTAPARTEAGSTPASVDHLQPPIPLARRAGARPGCASRKGPRRAVSHVSDIRLRALDGIQENCSWPADLALGSNIYAYAGGDPVNGTNPSGPEQEAYGSGVDADRGTIGGVAYSHTSEGARASREIDYEVGRPVKLTTTTDSSGATTLVRAPAADPACPPRARKARMHVREGQCRAVSHVSDIWLQPTNGLQETALGRPNPRRG